MGKFAISTVIDAPEDRVWQTLGDFGNTYRWNPSVVESHSTTDAPNGMGAGRRCDLGKGQWTEETITGWEDGKKMEVAIIDSNVPIKSAVVVFTSEQVGESQTKVNLDIDYKLKFGPLGVLMDLLMARRMYRKTMTELLAGLKHNIETGEEVGTELPAGVTV